MKKYLFIFALLTLTSCVSPQYFKMDNMKGKSFKLLLHDNAKIIDESEPDYKLGGMGLIGAMIKASGNDNSSLPMHKQYNIENPTEELGNYVSNLFVKKLGAKNKGSYKKLWKNNDIRQFVKTKQGKNESDYILAFDTPHWRLKHNKWSFSYRLRYVFAYELYKTSDSEEVLADACIYEPEGSYSRNEITHNGYEVIRNEMKKVVDFCKDELKKYIEPGKVVTMRSKFLKK